MTDLAAASGTFTIGDDLTVTRLGLGAMRITGEGIWGPPGDPAECLSLLRRAVDLGVDLIDTADSYGPEVSEQLIAEALHPYPDHLVIATKAGLERPGPGRWVPNGDPEHLRRACVGSLRRLQIDTIDLFQLHRIDPDIPAAEQFGVLGELQTEGKVRHLGLSEVSVDQLAAAREAVPVATVQNHYSLADREHDDVLEACEDAGIGFLPFFPLQAGELADPGGPAAGVADDLGATTAQVALAWLLHRSEVTLPIPGTSSITHLEENLRAAEIELSDDQVARLADGA